MFPKIPENLNDLSALELRKLADEIRTAARAAQGSTDSAVITAARQALADRKVVVLAAEKAETEEVAKELLDLETKDAEAQRAADEAKEVERSAVEEVQRQAEAPAEPTAPTAPTEDPGQASAAPAVRASTGVETEVVDAGFTPSALTVSDNVIGLKPGETFEDWTQLAEAMLSKGGDVRSNTTEKFRIAAVHGRFDKDHILEEKPFFNLAKFDEKELTAALCAPLTPTYNLACMNTTRRPVRSSLATYRAPRFGVKVYPSPSLSDVAGSAGIWTADMDAIPSATKNACATITCATPVDYLMYGVYWCLTVKNMLAMSFPELLEAYLNRGAANHSRIAEQQLLNAMGAETTAVNMPDVDYGAATTIATQVMHYLALYMETQRWDAVEHDMWAPRWLQTAIRIDLSRRNRRDGNWAVATEGVADQIFRDAGVTPHWFIDTPTWSPAIPPIATAGTLSALPSTATVLIAPRGKFALMDGGQLDIGVTGNNIYRDNVSNSRNEFTFFFENFEGVVNTTSCPAHRLVFTDLCWNGAQIADYTLNCLGIQ
ncbi:MAG: major capsid protein [Actinomycetota bacterium]|nr:major capsid protein [Actinomycetota bacterium]